MKHGMPSDSVSLVECVAERWVKSWIDGNGANFASLYSESGEYIDHAYRIRRVGRGFIARHFEIWKGSVPDFTMTAIDTKVLGSDVYFSYIGAGNFLHDLPLEKATGELTWQPATGESFLFRGYIMLSVNSDGLINRTEEFYSVNWFQQEDVEGYDLRK